MRQQQGYGRFFLALELGSVFLHRQTETSMSRESPAKAAIPHVQRKTTSCLVFHETERALRWQKRPCACEAFGIPLA
jgi:hypothetical protein